MANITSAWKYYSKVTIDNTANASALTNYQVSISLTSANFDFTRANSDGSDIRFTDSDKTTLLSYWIESYDSVGQTAKIWVKVPSIPASSTKDIWMYYGNAGAVSVGDGNAVFNFFDDFSSPSYTMIKGNASQVTSSGGKLRIDATSGYSSTYDIIAELNQTATIPANFSVEINVYLEKPAEWFGTIVETNGNGYSNGWYGWAGTEGAQGRWDGWAQALLAREIPHYTAPQGSTQNLRCDRLNGTMSLWDTDGSHIISNVNDNTYNSFSKIALRCYRGGIWQFNWLFVRQYTSPEPTASVGFIQSNRHPLLFSSNF